MAASLAPAALAEGGTAPSQATGSTLLFADTNLPAQIPITLPKGVNLVRATARVADQTDAVYVTMQHNETKQARCSFQYMTSWTSWPTGVASCAGLTALDRPGEQWVVNVSADSSSSADIRIDLSRDRLTGPVSALALDRLSDRTFEVGATQEVRIESFDGIKLHAQLTRPVTKADVPVIIVSSPYYYGSGLYEAGLVRDWVARGYAVMAADVRGYNRSEGCVEVWSYNEQKDQVELVEWAAKQPWSNGRVGMIGFSYVGTTPVEAAVRAPKALKAIVVGAPVINAYDDWHFGGVPNGENAASPAGYQALTGGYPDPSHGGANTVVYAGNGYCDATLAARANDPRAIYDAFYEERNFGKLAKKVKAAVLYTHGYADSNVKNVVGDPFFNDLRSPHLGIFGMWNHAWPPRPDNQTLQLAWMEQYVKGHALGLERLPEAIVMNNEEGVRHFSEWPSRETKVTDFYPNFEDGELVSNPVEATGQVLLTPEWAYDEADAGVPRVITLARALKEPLEIIGEPRLKLDATLQGAANGHVAAYLYDVQGSNREQISFGMANLAHRFGHDRWEPVAPGEEIEMTMEFLFTDYVLPPGHSLVLEIRGAHVLDWSAVTPGPPAILELTGSTRLVLPTLPVGSARRPAASEDWD